MIITKTITLTEDNIKELLGKCFQTPKDQIKLETSTIEVGSPMYPSKKTIISAKISYNSELEI